MLGVYDNGIRAIALGADRDDVPEKKVHCFCSVGMMQRIVLVVFHPPPFIAMRPEDLELLLTRQMPFGKYKGRVIADLPGHYLNWFARVGFPQGEIGQLLALMQEIDHNGLKAILNPLRSGRP